MLAAIRAAIGRIIVRVKSESNVATANNDMAVFSDQRRDEVRAWLVKISPAAAETFEALLALMYGPVIPGKGMLAAHCIRELRNVLIRHFVAVEARGGRLDYAKEVEALSAQWQEIEPLVAAHFTMNSTTPTETPDSTEAAVPIALLKSVGGLVEKHRNVTLNNREKAARLFATLQLGTEADGRLFRQRSDNWHKLVDWFVSIVHVGDDTRTDGDLLTNEFNGNVRLFLESLHTFATSRAYFSGLEEVDAILEEANRPAG